MKTITPDYEIERVALRAATPTQALLVTTAVSVNTQTTTTYLTHRECRL